jgi:hypothetical protein
MASLESLSNPLERTAVLPTAMNARKSGAGDLTWDANVQYFVNDVVLSTLDGGAYVFTGGATDRTAILGGADPAADPTLWTSLAPIGIQNSSIVAVPAQLGAAGVITLPAGATLPVPAGASVLCIAQGQLVTAAATVVGDRSSFIFTANGAGAVSSTTQVVPLVDTISDTTRFTISAVVTAGTGGTSVVGTATYIGNAPTFTGRITYIRLT